MQKTEKELVGLIQALVNEGEIDGTNPIRLTFQGLKDAESIKNSAVPSKKAFVAMWFDKEMNEMFEKAIAPAADECGFKAALVTSTEYNSDITDEIIAGIKSSRFVIADLTGYRGGVYYEAGYARGLGLPVILTCRRDWLETRKDQKNGEVMQEGVHFDVNHLNIIIWQEDKLDELKERLVDRIKATIL